MKKRIVHKLWAYIRVKNLLLNCGILLLYIFFGKLGLSLAFVNASTTAIWAPTGIAFASLLILGYRVFPAILVGAFVVNVTTAGGMGASLGIALGNTLEALVGVYLVKKFAEGERVFESIANIFKFIFFAAIVSTIVSATIGTTVLLLSNLTTVTNFWPVWLTWWLGDMGGNLIVAPFLVVWATHPRVNISYKGILHFFLSLLGILLITEIVFSGILPYVYLCIPLAVWIAFWFGRRGATATTLIVAIITVIETIHGNGPFGHQASVNQSLILLELFLSIFSLTALVFATAVLEVSKVQKTISSQEKRFKALIEKSFDAVVLIDTASKISYASPTFEKITGYSPEEIEGTVGFDLVYPDDRQKTMKELAKLVLMPGGTVSVEYRTIRKDGKIIWVEAVGTNLLLDPSVNAVVVNFHDITERKIAAAQILEEKEQDEAMLGSIGDGIVATDSKGSITMVNQHACELLEWKEGDILGKSITDVIPMQDENNKPIADSERPISKVLSLGKKIVTSSAVFYQRKDKTVFPVHFTVTPIIMEKKVVGAIEVFQDITKEKEIDKAKTEFVSLASHQLRTPLATINWYLEELMANGTNLSEKQTSYLQEVYGASKRMVDLINALLNTSRLELGTFVVEPVETDIKAVVAQAIHDLTPKIQAKQIRIKEEYENNLTSMRADAKLLAIIIQNLIANAIKYTKEKDTIVVKVLKGKEFTISIQDNGYGIPKSQQSKIFSKLFRADNARLIEPEGSGLGLYIVKSIVVATGGKISFVSEENKGTTFTIVFPLTGMQQKTGQKQLI